MYFFRLDKKIESNNKVELIDNLKIRLVLKTLIILLIKKDFYHQRWIS